MGNTNLNPVFKQLRNTGDKYSMYYIYLQYKPIQMAI